VTVLEPPDGVRWLVMAREPAGAAGFSFEVRAYHPGVSFAYDAEQDRAVEVYGLTADWASSSTPTVRFAGDCEPSVPGLVWFAQLDQGRLRAASSTSAARHRLISSRQDAACTNVISRLTATSSDATCTLNAADARFCARETGSGCAFNVPLGFDPGDDCALGLSCVPPDCTTSELVRGRWRIACPGAGAIDLTDPACVFSTPPIRCPPGMSGHSGADGTHVCAPPRSATCWKTASRMDLGLSTAHASGGVPGEESGQRWFYFVTTEVNADSPTYPDLARIKLFDLWHTFGAVPQALPAARIVTAGSTKSLGGAGQVPQIRADGLEMIFSTDRPHIGNPYQTYLLPRARIDDPWPRVAVPAGLTDSVLGVLLSDQRTLVSMETANGVWHFAVRSSTLAGDSSFTDRGELDVGLNEYFPPSLGCDGWTLIAMLSDTGPPSLITIGNTSPAPTFGASEPYPLPAGLPAGAMVSSIIEAAGCAAVYVATDSGTYAAAPCD
jgi:hypothetical protein